MGWHRDGSGLLVYRNRGRTVAQRHLFLYDNPGIARNERRRFGAALAHATFARGQWGPRQLRAAEKADRREHHNTGTSLSYW